MTASSTATRKAKGRKLQQMVRDALIKHFKLTEEDVRSTSMGASGEDILMSPAAAELFPYSVECKNQERVNIWAAYEQALEYSKREPLLIIKKNRFAPLVVLSFDTFLELHKWGRRHDERNVDQ